MRKVVLLDSGPLGMIAHPRANPEITEWLQQSLNSGTTVLVPELSDYEVRRELLRAKKIKSLRRLDRLKQVLGYLPITTDAMLRASEFWALARNLGRPTAKDQGLDGDCILAAQADTMSDSETDLVIATNNVGHLGVLTRAALWNELWPTE